MPVSRYRFVLATVVLSALMSAISNAAVLLPGAGLSNAGGTTAFPTGTGVASVTSPIVAPNFTGSLTTDVISGDAGNPFGGLTFIYLLTNNAGSADAIGRMTVTDYAGVSVDASYVASGDPPSGVNRSANGDTVGWSFTDASFSNTLLPGTNAAALVLRTNVQGFIANSANVIDGSTATVAALGPDFSTVLPEPAMFSAIALVGLMLGRRR